ncbi:alkylated DNA repair protein alkB like 6 [Blastomyces silverae]|uniref:Alkylated DNA repair protein alkB like 6 n=1 Tax=Blastomyces silverae TaxID=2060906 RepID=A0A0H1BGN7_9EURO|nr:alkylated DNA repair protein alkB like 6 [Blastomyces silverae]
MADDQGARICGDVTEEVMLPIQLEEARIKSIPESAYYIPDFITQDEEEGLLQKITSVPIPRWTHLSRRRLQTWPSALSKSNTLLASPLPQWLISPIISRFTELGIFQDSPHKAANHVLINEYQPGQGIMPHEDGAAYYPVVATVSLGAPIVLEMSEKTANREHKGFEVSEQTTASQFRILQERRSLLVTTGKLYTDYLHGIEERMIDADLNSETVCNWGLLGDKEAFAAGSYARETRISLTYRDVLKVSKLGNSMKFLGSK